MRRDHLTFDDLTLVCEMTQVVPSAATHGQAAPRQRAQRSFPYGSAASLSLTSAQGCMSGQDAGSRS